MSNIKELLNKSLLSNYGYLTDLPSPNKYEIGDFGSLGASLMHRGNIRNQYNVEYRTKDYPNNDEFTYSSNKGITITSKNSGEVKNIPGSLLTELDAGINISFDSKNSIFLKILDYSISKIVNIEEIEIQFIDLFRQGIWPKNYYFVSEIIKAKHALLVVSKSNKSNIDIKVDGQSSSFDESSSPFSKITGKFEILCTSGKTIHYVNHDSIVLYKLVGIVKKPFANNNKAKLQEKSQGLEENYPTNIGFDGSGEYFFDVIQELN